MLLALLTVALLLALNAVFAMSELAVMTSRPSRLQQAAARGDRGAVAALALARDPTRFLSTVQVGITLVGIFAGALGEDAFSTPISRHLQRVEWLTPASADTLAMLVVVLVLTYLSLVVGELVPKRIALAYPEAVASGIARPLDLLSRAGAWPVRLLSASTEWLARLLRVPSRRAGDDVSEEDIRALVARAASTGVFDPLEHAIFQRALRLGDLRVRALMVPRADVVWIDESMGIEEVRVLLGTSPFSHFPVCRGSLDNLVGVVHIKDLIAYGLLAGRDFRPAAVAQKPLFVPENLPALRLLETMQQRRTHIAFVVDEHGGVEGIITINDIVQALVGSLARQGDEEPPGAVRRADGSFLIDGRLPLHEMAAVLQVPPEALDEHPDIATAAGLVVSLLDRIPRRGESVRWRGWRLEVVDMDENRVDQVLAVREDGP
jgi:putative hemolysin